MMKKLSLIGISCLFLFAVAFTAQATLWEFFNGNIPSIETRGLVAEQAGIVDSADQYTGTYAQNIFLEQYLRAPSEIFGAVKPFRPSGYSSTLASSLAEEGTETELVVNSISLPDDTDLASTSFGSLLILTVGEGDNEEKISISDLDTSTKIFTIAQRGLAYGSYTSLAANKHRHLPGEIVYISDDDHFLNQQYMDLASDESISGDKTFSGITTISGTLVIPEPTLDTHAASKNYADNIANQGAATSTETIAGIGELATRTEMASSTYDASDPKFLHTRYSTSSPDVRGVNVVVSENDGYIDSDWLRTTDDRTVNDLTVSNNATLATTTMFGTQGGLMPSGSITAYATTTAPQGWLACDGSSLATTTYADLFAVIGYSYGGSSANFNLPNLNGREIVGYGSATSTYDTMGETGGEDEHTQSIDEMPSHNHSFEYDGAQGTSGITGTATKEHTSTDTMTTTSTGGGSAFNVMDPFIVLRYIIKY